VFGLSTQTLPEQQDTVKRLHLPFPLLSDAELGLARAMTLPTMVVGGKTMIKRLAMIIDDGQVTQVFYPVFPPDRNAADVLAWLKEHPA
jgi:peroxiredoxin (alkyl hydroperoxide reductase subunit C)